MRLVLVVSEIGKDIRQVEPDDIFQQDDMCFFRFREGRMVNLPSVRLGISISAYFFFKALSFFHITTAEVN